MFWISSSDLEQQQLSAARLFAHEQDRLAVCDNCIASNVKLMGNLNHQGEYPHQRFRFDNVFLKDNATLAVNLPPHLALPTGKERVLDAVNGNMRKLAVPPLLPVSIRAFGTRGLVNISYLRPSAWEQPQCKRWEERPVYVLYTPHSNNIWHMLNDALMGAFQTLREEGLLPLAEIDGDGNMQEYTDDLEEACPMVHVVGEENKPYRLKKCRPKKGLFSPHKCSPEKDAWCRPGLVAVNRTSGPILLLGPNADAPLNKWSHLFRAVSGDLRTWDSMAGTCFRELYIGKSNTLNLYVDVLDPSTATPETAHTITYRRKALETFKGLVLTAELEKQAVERKMKETVKWPGYPHAGMERLRKGIGSEDVYMVNVLREIRAASIEESKDYTSAEKKEILDLMEVERSTLQRLLAPTETNGNSGVEERKTHELTLETEKEYVVENAARSSSSSSSSASSSRPVVTFMWRNLSRSVLNAADIVEYLLLKFNVTVRITTFYEPLMEAHNLMNNTDVLIGMHGAGWTNGLFLRPGVAGLQMFPYGWEIKNDTDTTGIENESSSSKFIRGSTYKNVVLIQGGSYFTWVNPSADHAFMKRFDFRSDWSDSYSLHPRPEWPLPKNALPGSHWIYQNTVVSMESIAPVLDAVMAAKGIVPRASSAAAISTNQQ